MEPKKTEADRTYWHPAFYADIQIELKDDADNLEFENEHQLGTNPMEIDVLIIKKNKDRPVKKNIGKIFRKYNIIEYKSPDDSLSPDDFYKVYGYTCFYKADAAYADSIPARELTITFVTEKYPQKLIRHLREVRNYTVKSAEAGIYQVNGDFFPIQIIVTKKLAEKENLWLKSLTNKLSEVEKAEKLAADYTAHSDNHLYRSVMETIIRANHEIFQEVSDMGDILMELVQDKFDRRLKEAIEKEKIKIKEDVKKEITDSVTEEVTKNVTEEVTKSVTEEITKSVTEEVTKSVTEEVTKKVTEKTKLIQLISLIQKKCKKNKPLSVISDELESKPAELLSIYDIVFKNPEKTVEELYELMPASKTISGHVNPAT